jgi:hypothetical protein
VRQVLQPGAAFVLEFANKQNLKAILRYGLRRQSWNPFSPDPVEFARLNFDFHPAAVRAWLRQSGFSVERQLTVSHLRMGILKRWVPLGLLVSLDSLFQWSGAWWQFTPSVFVKAQAQGSSPVTAPGAFFCCPVCSEPLPELQTELACPACGRRWPFQDGIYDFRLDQAS